jgi:hypothetical protein
MTRSTILKVSPPNCGTLETHYCPFLLNSGDAISDPYRAPGSF